MLALFLCLFVAPIVFGTLVLYFLLFLMYFCHFYFGIHLADEENYIHTLHMIKSFHASNLLNISNCKNI